MDLIIRITAVKLSPTAGEGNASVSSLSDYNTLRSQQLLRQTHHHHHHNHFLHQNRYQTLLHQKM